MNKVLLVGRLATDPELKVNSETQKFYCNFKLAVDGHYNKKSTEKEKIFFKIVCYGKTAEVASNYLTKGSLISLTGKINFGSYTNEEGEKKYYTSILADDIQFLYLKKREVI